jgi:hypothetical protein
MVIPRPLLLAFAASVLGACAASGPRARPGIDEAADAAPVARSAGGLPGLASRTAGLERKPGLFPLYIDRSTGRLFVEVPSDESRFLYYVTPAASSGSGGLIDVGTLQGNGAVVHFQRHGQKLLLVQENSRFHAADTTTALGRSVARAFAGAVIGSFTVLAEEEGRTLIDATDFFLRDATDATGSLRVYDQASYRLDRERSAIYRPGTRAFPRNTEVEALLTFTSDNPGPKLIRHSPDGRTLTVHVRHSFVELPPPGFVAREADPRLGFITLAHYDFARDFDQGYRRQLVRRWRLSKDQPTGISEPIEPITFYMDPAIPRAYREAIREGVLYWNDVLESAGFRNAIRVEDLPNGADPLDLRYSVLQWNPRSEVGSSYVSTLVDPRTGEILKATVHLDSHRSLVDYNTYMGLRPALRSGEPDAEAFVMARRRFLAAHELAHALAGFQHTTLSATAVGFFVPGVLPVAGDRLALDLSQAYLAEPTDYDRWLVRYAYTPLEPATEAAALSAIAQEGLDRGLRYLADYHGGTGSHPLATGRRQSDDVLADLTRAMAARRIALARFDETAVEPGEPLSRLFGRLVPVYFHHRYLLFAVGKAVGGFEYAYAARGDGQVPTRVLPPSEQWRALELLLSALQPEELAIPGRVAALIPPPSVSELPSELEPIVGGRTDTFTYVPGEAPWITIPLNSGSAFDALAWARTLAFMIVTELLHPTRAARLVALHALEPASPTIDEVIRRTVDATWGMPVPDNPAHAALRRVSSRVVLDQLLSLATSSSATPEVRAVAGLHLERLAARLSNTRSGDAAEQAHMRAALRDLDRWARID